MTIKFYSHKNDYGWASNFYRTEIILDGKTWASTEHYFQAQKFAGTKWEEEIRNEKVTPKGTPASIKLRKIGIEEHEQKGVTAPKIDAKKLPKPNFLLLIHFQI